jgi:hypothetical protein
MYIVCDTLQIERVSAGSYVGIANTAPILFQFDSQSEPVNICSCGKRIRWKAYRDFWNILFMVIGDARFLLRLNDATHPFRQTPRCGERLKLTHEIYVSGKGT